MTATAASLASGKDHRQENFPVASFLLRRAHRAPVMAFYRFARAADDVADSATASAAEKLALLGAMRATLGGSSGASPEALALREALARRRLPPRHALDLLGAFEQDCTVRRYPSWDALIAYCSISAMPVGRYVLDVHGEDRATWPASDALCAALQIVNHLQDCGKDYRALDRVYLPLDVLAEAGARVEDLAADRATLALRAAIAALARRTQALLVRSSGLSAMVRDRRLAAEIAVIQKLAESLAALLERRDPLGERVHHGKGHAAAIAARAALGSLFGRAA